jgi:HEAT repeat protein
MIIVLKGCNPMSLFGPPNISKMKAKKDIAGLVKALEYQKDSDIRSSAAEALGEISDSGAIQPLFHLLENERVFYVRKTAVLALGSIGDPSVLMPLCSLLIKGHADDVNDAIEEVINKFGPRAVQPMVQAIDSLPSHYNAQIDKILVRMGKANVEPFTDILSNPSNKGRRTAIKYLADLADIRAIPVLIECLSEDWEEIRSCAIYGLKLIGTPAFDSLVQVLEGKNLTAKKSALRVLEDYKNPLVVVPIISQLSCEDMDIRLIAMEVLGKFGDPRALESIISQLSCKDLVVRKTALEVLGNYGDPRVVEPIISQLSSDDSAYRQIAIEILGKLGDNRAVEPLISQLYSNDPSLRLSSIEALGMLGDSRAIKPLIDRLAIEPSGIKKAVIKALGFIGGPQSGEELSRIFDETTEETLKVECAAALLEQGNVSAKDLLFKMLLDPIKRTTALEALSTTKEPEMINRIAGFFLVNGTIPSSWNRIANPMYDDAEKFNAVGKTLEKIGSPAIPSLISVLKILLNDLQKISSVDSSIWDQSPEVHMYGERTMKAIDRINKILGAITNEYFEYPEGWINWWEKNKDK